MGGTMKILRILLLVVVISAALFLSACSLPFFDRNSNDGISRGAITAQI